MKRLYDFVEKTVGMDKVAHFFGIAFIALCVALLYAHVIAPGHTTLTYSAWAFIFGVAVAVGKECVDVMNDREFDLSDIAAGVVGAFVSFLVVLVLL